MSIEQSAYEIRYKAVQQPYPVRHCSEASELMASLASGTEERQWKPASPVNSTAKRLLSELLLSQTPYQDMDPHRNVAL